MKLTSPQMRVLEELMDADEGCAPIHGPTRIAANALVEMRLADLDCGFYYSITQLGIETLKKEGL